MNKISGEKICLLAIVAVAASLRFVHITWGLPEIYEEATPYSIAWRMWHWGQPGFDPNPHFFNYPALTFYVNFLMQSGYYLLGHLVGWFPTLEAYHAANVADQSTWITGARVISALFDVGTVAVIFFLSREYVGSYGAILTSLLAAINPLLLRSAQSVNVDTPMTFFVVLSLYCITRLYRSGELKWYVRSGICIGLAASSKYNGAFLLPVLLAAHLFRSGSLAGAARSLRDIRLVFAAVIAGALFVALNPYILLSFKEFYQDFSFEEVHMTAGHLGIDPSQGTASYYFFGVIPNNLGIPMALMIAASILLIIIRFEKDQLLLLIFPLLYLAILQSWTMRAERYVLPALPSLLLIGTAGISIIGRKLAQRYPEQLRSLAIRYSAQAVVVMVVIARPAIADISYHKSLSLPDTRAITKEWILRNVPPGSVIATLPIGIAIPDSLYRVFPIPYLGVNIERMAPFYDTRWYEDFDVVIGSDFDYQRYIKDPNRYHQFLAYYDSLRTRFDPLFLENPTGLQPGPGVWLFHPRAEIQQAKFDAALFRGLGAVPESVWVNRFLHNIAFMLTNKSKLGKAEQVYREVVSMEPNDMIARRSLVGILIDQGKIVEALDQAQSGLRVSPDDPVLLGLEGKIYVRLHKDEIAEGLMQKAITLNPKIEFPYDDLILLYRSRGDNRGALSVLKKHLQILDPRSEKARIVANDIHDLERRR